ncbi:MAG TPA: ATP synthase F1 subunit epsilon [Candidatus Saccharimonadales bacterium]|nr:ATP synthase F1 subunit epsilon [Candidatus Saccharimonadales bacterium]
MYLDIITPENNVLSEEIDEVLVPTEKGQIGVLKHHINIVTKLTPGEIIVKAKGKENLIAVSGGFLEVSNGKVTILSDYAEHAKDIDVQRATEAQKRAEELLSKKKAELSEEEIIKIEAELRLSLLQQHIAQHHRRRSN